MMLGMSIVFWNTIPKYNYEIQLWKKQLVSGNALTLRASVEKAMAGKWEKQTYTGRKCLQKTHLQRDN